MHEKDGEIRKASQEGRVEGRAEDDSAKKNVALQSARQV
jgi:hypothetical protein